METQAKAYYFDVLYPFQDQVLQLMTRLDTGFHLTGGTAASAAICSIVFLMTLICSLTMITVLAFGLNVSCSCLRKARDGGPMYCCARSGSCA